MLNCVTLALVTRPFGQGLDLLERMGLQEEVTCVRPLPVCAWPDSARAARLLGFLARKCSSCDDLVICVNYEENEQLELLNQLLNDEQFRQNGNYEAQVGEQKDGSEVSRAASQKSIRSTHVDPSSVLETRPDPGREHRKGVPEVIFGQTKEAAQIIAMAHGLITGSGRAIISRMPPESFTPVKAAFHEYTVSIREAARAMVIYSPEYVRRSTGGHVGVISAGTSDIPVAEEAVLIAEEMGCRVTCIYDVGVAGLHRL